jgi:O-antigen/teichoic acid export membrane protein
LTCFLAAALYFATPLIADFFSLPSLKNYLPLVGIMVLVTGPSLLFRAFLEKNMYFKQLALIAIARNLIVLGGTVVFLVLGLGVTGVIYGQILGAVFTTLSILAMTKRFKTVEVSLYFSATKLIPFIKFGFFISAKQLMTFAAHRLDEVVIGYLLNPEILGIYHFGKDFLEKARGLMTMSFGKVLFPVFSKLKNQPDKLTFAYQRISRYIAFGAFPVFGGIAVTAHLFVPAVFGVQWIDSVVVFQVFSISMILLVLTANVSSSLLYAINKPDLVFYIDVFTNALYFISLSFFADQGMLALLVAYSFYVIYKTLTLQFFANRQLESGFINYLQEMTIPAVSGLIMVVCVLLFQIISNSTIGLNLKLAGSIVVGSLVYCIMAWSLGRETVGQLKAAILKGDIGG